MTPAPISAFEAYQQNKILKKKSASKKRKSKVITLEPLQLKRIKKHLGASNMTEVSSLVSVGTKDEVTKSVPSVQKDITPSSTGDVVQEHLVRKKVKSPKPAKAQRFNSKDQAMNGAIDNAPRRQKHNISLSKFLTGTEIADNMLAWMINPIKKEMFFSQYWEKRPVHISRDSNRNYYHSILSTAAIDSMLRNNCLLFGKNVDITSYIDGQRKTHNPVGRAHAGVVWDFYRNGGSVRLLNPQTYHPELYELLTTLQELFGSFVGANVYLTPPDSQGFAPHYDDIEAFVLQVEGRKLWRVYAPRNNGEKLPRTSSPNFTDEDLGEPILEVLVKEGDMLYFPRGFIHQASTVPGHHSLHLTVSTYQHNSWADLLEKLVPAALANAIEEDEDFRGGMPLDVLQHIGAVHSEKESSQRQYIFKKIERLFSKLFKHAPVDAAADQLGKQFQHDALPPCLTPNEKNCSVFENSDRMGANGKLAGTVHLTSVSRIRLTRLNVLRLVSEEEPDTVKIYHCIDNSLEYHAEDLQCIEIPVHMASAIEFLIHSYPEFVAIEALPLDEMGEKIQISAELWERGLILTETPLKFMAESRKDL